ncbi:MAG TPA: hypothetical protein VMI94_29040 [Bryobacteraceae bacterium]|nr:hypothetical protein [Bryobacteraceae bacterium]
MKRPTILSPAVASLLALSLGTTLAGQTAKHEFQTPQEAFLYGSIGAEFMPLPVFQVLPDLFPDQMQPGGAGAGDWIDQFGFVRSPAGTDHGLPLGFNVTKFLPKSGGNSPLPWVGFTCALCHTAVVRESEAADGVLVSGMGNPSLDLVPFGDAIKTIVLSDRMTVHNVAVAYRNKFNKSISLLDRLFISLWLSGARKQIRTEIPLRGAPFAGSDLRNAALFPSGPARIMAVRETVRRLVDQTPIPDGGPSKLPCLYQEERREWAQFDGSVRDPYTRNSIAAMGVGATAQNLRKAPMLDTIRQSYTYVASLDGPKYRDVFPGHSIDRTAAERGFETYRTYCGDCHGWPGATRGTWVNGERQGQIISLDEIGTDPERVTVRFYNDLAKLIFDYFPTGHPLKPKPGELRPTHGYIAIPIESTFSRAPFLHNGSIATLAELINLRPRRRVFYRGQNLFDPIDVGLLVSESSDAYRYYRFNADERGNSNRGHDYPWPYHGPGWNEDALRDLLEYLKTL